MNAQEAFLAQVGRSIRQQRAAMDQAINDYAAGATRDCLSAREVNSLKGPGSRLRAQRRLYAAGWKAAYLMVANIGDHLSAIADTATKGEPRVFAHMTLARAALEGAARLSYLLHPPGTLQDRLLRAAFVLLASAEEELKAVPDLATISPALGDAANARATSRHKDVIALIGESGIAIQRGRDGRSLRSVAWADTPDQTVGAPNVTALLKKRLPSRPSAYRVGSGAAHSQPWVLDADEVIDLQTPILHCPFDALALVGSVDLAINASILVLETFAPMMGQDAGHQRTKAQQRERAVVLLAPSSH